eukprot:gene9672-11467_t
MCLRGIPLYLAPDGTFEAVACDEETDAVPSSTSEDVPSERCSPNVEQRDTQIASVVDDSQANLEATDAPTLMSASESDTDSEAEDAPFLRESVRHDSCSSDEDHGLDKTYVVPLKPALLFTSGSCSSHVDSEMT